MNCKHQNYRNGPRLPLQYGSAPTIICIDCGMWKDDRPHEVTSRFNLWREAAELLIKVARGHEND